MSMISDFFGSPEERASLNLAGTFEFSNTKKVKKTSKKTLARTDTFASEASTVFDSHVLNLKKDDKDEDQSSQGYSLSSVKSKTKKAKVLSFLAQFKTADQLLLERT